MREPEWGDPINAYTKWVVAALVTLCVLFVGVGFASAGQGVSAHAPYMAKTSGIMAAAVRVEANPKQVVEVCLGTSGNGRLHCKSAYVRNWRVGLSYPCHPRKPFRLWLLRVEGYPVASVYSRC